jgi:hypothetical protein
MYKLFFRFTVTTLTILTANLLTTYLSDYLVSYRYAAKPLIFTFAGMLIIVVVFYPLFMRLETWVEKISVRIVRSGRSLAGKYLGLLLTLSAGILLLFYFYARMWFHIDFVRILIHGEIGKYF